MPIDYHTFRKQGWEERLTIFNALSAEEKADLVRTHISLWLQAHREELTAAQIEVVQANIRFVTPELYTHPKREELLNAIKELEFRTATLPLT